MPELNPYAAGIDVGATKMYVAVPQDSDAQPVRSYLTFTQDLEELASWLHSCGVKTVAMESTGVYWIPLFQILEARGFTVCLVNARDWRNAPGRKTDVCDCQWLQYLHACGLLRASFRPKQEVCAARSLLRHREGLITAAGSNVQLMQKALTQMNLQIHHVISDITGKTGLAILDAILAGERNTEVLSLLRDPRIKTSAEVIAKSLVGHSRPEHLFTLKQALCSYRHYQTLLEECDQEIERVLSQFDAASPPDAPSEPPSTKPKAERGNTLRFQETSVRDEMFRLLGSDLTLVPGFGTQTLAILFSEVGRDMSAFPSDKRFCSWLGLCPGNRISGDKVLSSKTRHVPSRAAHAFRMAAQSLWHSRSALGDYYRRLCARLGRPAGITATAHKLARIFYHLLRTKQSYNESVFAQEQERANQSRERRLAKEATLLGLRLVPARAE
ncbi:MAG: IS110 family transposase [Armatimonadetes bacterium]|nr:IS110 family transposase [Armatimonadota bacterium]